MMISLICAAMLPVPDAVFVRAFDGRPGAFVVMDCSTGEVQRHNPSLCATPLPPCSTFKIWNTAIGLESGLLTSADQPFYKWDGMMRSIEGWNRDLSLRQAYAVSCVPAYQDLARRIGTDRMNSWIKKLAYGDGNTSSGNDVFWLPAPGRTPLQISADEQVRLLVRLVTGELPFSRQTLETLQTVMLVKETGRGKLFGKTGTGGKGSGGVGWFVGYVVSGKTRLAFACVLTGETASGKAARAVVEEIYPRRGCSEFFRFLGGWAFRPSGAPHRAARRSERPISDRSWSGGTGTSKTDGGR